MQMNWLPDMDLNHDKVIQSHLCYRYTIGQSGALGKLVSFSPQSSRQTTRNWICNFDGRSFKARRRHLPLAGGEGRGEGERKTQVSNAHARFHAS